VTGAVERGKADQITAREGWPWQAQRRGCGEVASWVGLGSEGAWFRCRHGVEHMGVHDLCEIWEGAATFGGVCTAQIFTEACGGSCWRTMKDNEAHVGVIFGGELHTAHPFVPTPPVLPGTLSSCASTFPHSSLALSSLLPCDAATQALETHPVRCLLLNS